MSILNKTVTHQLHGGCTLTGPCPAWCDDDHDRTVHPADMLHSSESVYVTGVPMAEPGKDLDPDVGVLNAWMAWAPYQDGVGISRPVIALAADEAAGWRSYDLDGFTKLLDQLEQHLPKLRALRDQLAATLEEVEKL